MINTRFYPGKERVVLFCLPYAGVGASIFSNWASYLLNGQIAIVPIQLPGREERVLEEAYTSMPHLIDDLARELRPWLCNKPFAFFGHCMGALIAYDLIHSLNELYDCQPLHLFVSACPAPQHHQVSFPLHRLPPEEFLRQITKIGEVITERADQKVANILFPGLKADFMLYENYCYVNQGPLPCHITTLRGMNDHYIPKEKLALWQELSLGEFAEQEFRGDHFYLHHQMDHLVKYVAESLIRDLRLGEKN